MGPVSMYLARLTNFTSPEANHVAVQIKGKHFYYLYSAHFITLGEMSLSKKLSSY